MGKKGMKERFFFVLQVRDWNRRYADRLHLSVCVDELVQLDGQLAGLRRAEPASVDAAADVLLDHEAEEQWQADALVVEAADVAGQEADVLWSQGCDACAPVVFAGVSAVVVVVVDDIFVVVAVLVADAA